MKRLFYYSYYESYLNSRLFMQMHILLHWIPTIIFCLSPFVYFLFGLIIWRRWFERCHDHGRDG